MARICRRHACHYSQTTGAVSSVVERLVYTERVGGSKPSPPSLVSNKGRRGVAATNSAPGSMIHAKFAVAIGRDSSYYKAMRNRPGGYGLGAGVGLLLGLGLTLKIAPWP